MLPERPGFDVVDEADGRKIHVPLSFLVHDLGLDYLGGLRRSQDRPLKGRRVVLRDGASELGRAVDIRLERMIVQTPDAVRAGGLEGVRRDEATNDAEIGLEDAQDDLPLDVASRLPVLERAELP